MSGVRSGTIMLMQVVPEAGEIKLLSVPRDLPGRGRAGVKDKINTIYAYGGVQQAQKVEEDFARTPVVFTWWRPSSRSS